MALDHQTNTCHLLRLPAELRLQIYECYFGQPRICFIQARPSSTRFDLDEHDRDGPAGPGLLRVCRSIHNEAKQMLGATTTADIDLVGTLYYGYGFSSAKPIGLGQLGFLATLSEVQLRIEVRHDLLCDRFGKVKRLHQVRNILHACDHGKGKTMRTITFTLASEACAVALLDEYGDFVDRKFAECVGRIACSIMVSSYQLLQDGPPTRVVESMADFVARVGASQLG